MISDGGRESKWLLVGVVVGEPDEGGDSPNHPSGELGGVTSSRDGNLISFTSLRLSAGREVYLGGPGMIRRAGDTARCPSERAGFDARGVSSDARPSCF